MCNVEGTYTEDNIPLPTIDIRQIGCSMYEHLAALLQIACANPILFVNITVPMSGK